MTMLLQSSQLCRLVHIMAVLKSCYQNNLNQRLHRRSSKRGNKEIQSRRELRLRNDNVAKGIEEEKGHITGIVN